MNFKKICTHMCIYYTAATFFLLFLYLILLRDLSSGFSPIALVSILPFSALFAFANLNYRYSEMRLLWRVLLHYVLTIGSAFVFLYLPNKAEDAKASQGFILILVFSLIYFVIMGIILGVRARVERVKCDTKQYKSLYRDNGKKSSVPSDTKAKQKNKDDYQNVYKKK